MLLYDTWDVTSDIRPLILFYREIFYKLFSDKCYKFVALSLALPHSLGSPFLVCHAKRWGLGVGLGRKGWGGVRGEGEQK